jgi:UPF0042 nucleotide-binding protein
MSGAGKATVARMFEDLDYSVVDNIPPSLLTPIYMLTASRAELPRGLAVVIDSRCHQNLDAVGPILDEITLSGVRPVLIFLDAEENSLVQRFKETRRPHPMLPGSGGIIQGIRAERAMVAPLKDRADKIIDTTGTSVPELRELIAASFSELDTRANSLTVMVTSFGYKYGLPLDADLVFDVRFLRNPYYSDTLRDLDGRNAVVASFVMGDDGAEDFLASVKNLLYTFLPRYELEGKAYISIAVGCTGGQHRSVVIAEEFVNMVRDMGFRSVVLHRDVARRLATP